LRAGTFCRIPSPVASDADHHIKLPVFEGPLDLLLFLIRKNEIDIYDIPIEQVTRQYLDVLFTMQQLDLDLAGEFFVMAATLMEIKSRMLLPKELQAVDPNVADEEEMDPRWELVHQLIQYRRFKEAAAKLDERAVAQQNLIARYVSALSDRRDRPLKNTDRIELWNVFNVVLRRLAEKVIIGEIHDEQVTVADQMEMLLARLQTQPRFVFSQLFATTVSLRTLIATFLAVLELTRLKRLRIRQDEAYADILCEATNENALETRDAPSTVRV
jgi:segregation and condensation protein A